MITSNALEAADGVQASELLKFFRVYGIAEHLDHVIQVNPSDNLVAARFAIQAALDEFKKG